MTDPIPSLENVTTDKAATRLVETATQTAAKAREQAALAARRTADSIEGNPLSVLVGGMAIGVIAGSLLPRTVREANVLGGVGKQLSKGASTAFKAARDAGKAELISAGLDKSGIRDQISKIVQTIGDAATKATDAAKATTKKGE
ncbi:MAG: hypothetical protein ACKVOB_05215 [Sphingomonas sp.]